VENFLAQACGDLKHKLDSKEVQNKLKKKKKSQVRSEGKAKVEVARVTVMARRRH